VSIETVAVVSANGERYYVYLDLRDGEVSVFHDSTIGRFPSRPTLFNPKRSLLSAMLAAKALIVAHAHKAKPPDELEKAKRAWELANADQPSR